jgi:ABC-type glycerol-3-phosphate transport system substrate-binding protein
MKASACRGLATATLTLLGLISAAALPLHAQTADDIYAKAKTEGAFVLYVGGPTAPWEATARIFEQRYPGIKVAITGGFSNVLDKKIDQQIKDGKLEVDTAIFQTLQDFVRAGRRKGSCSRTSRRASTPSIKASRTPTARSTA